MPTSKHALSAVQLLAADGTTRFGGTEAQGEMPFVSKHARVVTATGTSSTAAIGFALGSQVALARVELESVDRTNARAFSSTGVQRSVMINGPSADRGVVHLSMTPDSTALGSIVCGSTSAADTYENLAMLSRTAVICAADDGVVAGLATGHLERSTPLKNGPRSEVARRSGAEGDHGAEEPRAQLTWITLAEWESTGEDEHSSSQTRALLCRGPAISVARFGSSYNSIDLHTVAVAHEYFNEARIFDLNTGAVAHRIYTTHGPVSIQAMYASSSSSPLLCIAEGPIASVWDIRAGSGSNACVSRLTLLDEHVTDVCCTHDFASRNVVATAATDRSVTIFDARKWTKVSVEQNVLKYAPVGIASAGVQCSAAYFPATVLAVGVDTEVRAVDILSSASTSAAKALAVASKPTTTDSADAANANAPGTETAPLQGTFRQRLASSQHCKAAWHGSPAQAAIGGSLWAIALSTHGEIFGASTGIPSIAS